MLVGFADNSLLLVCHNWNSRTFVCFPRHAAEFYIDNGVFDNCIVMASMMITFQSLHLLKWHRLLLNRLWKIQSAKWCGSVFRKVLGSKNRFGSFGIFSVQHRLVLQTVVFVVVCEIPSLKGAIFRNSTVFPFLLLTHRETDLLRYP
jgi:hypothetical protein